MIVDNIDEVVESVASQISLWRRSSNSWEKLKEYGLTEGYIKLARRIIETDTENFKIVIVKK